MRRRLLYAGPLVRPLERVVPASMGEERCRGVISRPDADAVMGRDEAGTRNHHEREAALGGTALK
jgi:hypothetical protein